ncbi:MAG: GDSL-type esterase/lipase family protein [Acidimicrobiales bacterium]
MVRRWRSVVVGALLVVAAVPALAVAAPSGAAPATGRATYVALGDSYSSGAGLAPFDAGSGSCARSPRAYPSIVARALARDAFTFVACSGATTSQIIAQVDAARTALRHAALVTLTAGGNDLSFSNLLVSCVGGVTSLATPVVRYESYASSPTACAAAIAQAARELAATVAANGAVVVRPADVAAHDAANSPIEAGLTRLLAGVEALTPRSRASAARILVVQYPLLLADASVPVCRVGAAPLTLSSAPAIYPVFPGAAARQLRAINQLLRRETATVVARVRRRDPGVALVTASGFAPLDCRLGTSVDLNGLSVASLTSGGSFHPTAAGQAVLARAVLAARGR